jgi:site-specific recombinase XerD
VALTYETALREEYAKIDRGGKQRRLFKDLMLEFGEQHLPTMKPSAAQRYKVSARPLLKHFEDMYLDQVNKTTLAEFVRTRRRDGASTATVRRDLGCLSSALSCAMRWDWIDQNIVKAMDKRGLKESQPRVRWLRQREYQTIMDVATTARQRTMIVLLVETGMRLGEMLGLDRRHDIDLERKEIYLTRTKTNAPRVIPLSRKAAAQLRAHPTRMGCDWLFYTDEGKRLAVTAVSAELKRTIRRAKVKDFRPHDFRHTFASWYLQNGGRLEQLQQILGHKRIEQTMKYAHLATKHLHEDMARVGTRAGTSGTDLERKGGGGSGASC